MNVSKRLAALTLGVGLLTPLFSLTGGTAAHAARANATTLPAADVAACKTQTQISANECAAIASLVNSTNFTRTSVGRGYSLATPCDAPTSGYSFVRCRDGHVDGIQLWRSGVKGTIPAEIGTGLPHLESLALSETRLSGAIPESLRNLTSLKHLSLGGCALEARSFAGLTGTMPDWIGSLTNLERLEIYCTKLNGAIPTSIGNLTKLKELWLTDNKLSGPIPSSIGNLKKLESLGLRNNKLTGKVPPSLTTIDTLMPRGTPFPGGGQSVGSIYLGGNKNLNFNGWTDAQLVWGYSRLAG